MMKEKRVYSSILCLALIAALLLTGILGSCGKNNGTADGFETEASAVSQTETADTTDTEDNKLSLKVDSLSEYMRSLWGGGEVINETVMFLDAGEEKELMYKADKIMSVTSYDGKVTYTEGKDYALKDGKIVALNGGALPIITSAKYYGVKDSGLVTNHNGENVGTYCGEGRVMTDWQVNVKYTHSDSWNGYRQNCETEQFATFIEKLRNGEDVTVIFYGDSITYGASASFIRDYAPYQYSYPLLFTQALADLYDYNVHYVNTGLEGTGRVPSEKMKNARGKITYINTAVGGWTTQNGLQNYDTYVKPFIDQYGCDLFVLALGMNDPQAASDAVASTQSRILKKVLEQTPDAGLLWVSTMVPNPEAVNGWYGNQDKQESVILNWAEHLRQDGASCAVVCMTSVSKSILERKDFRDYSGNNINHPNDFFVRVYAQCLFEAVIGYENLK